MMAFVEIKDPQWADVEQTMIDLQVRQDGSDTFLPYTAMVCNDVESTELFGRATAGDFGNVATVSTARYEKKYREKRNALLKKSDWTQLPDVPQATKDAWAVYRQALRELPTQSGFPFSISWPTEPQ